MQGKMKREHTIPVSQEIARIVQEQQQAVRNSERSLTLLFSSSRGNVMKQASFAQRINRLAYDHQIRDVNGKLPLSISPVSTHGRNSNGQPGRASSLHSAVP